VQPPDGSLDRVGTGRPRTLVIVPTYNERENLQPLVAGVLAVDPDLDLLIVDDGSPDGTGELAEAMAGIEPRVSVLHRAGKLGLGSAYVAGYLRAVEMGYDRVVQMDGDLSHRPEDLRRVLDASEGADVVIGSRTVAGGRVEGWSLLRRLISRGGSLFARLMLGLPVRDCTSGFKCLRRCALLALDLHRLRSNGYVFQVEVNDACHRAGLRLAEVPIVFPARRRGKSKMNLGIVIEAARLVIALRLGRGMAVGG
jgi:dolichol-phosphate mannosyltransferase